MAKRPKPFGVGDVRVSAIRGPRDGLWYWRAVRHSTRKTLWTGWASPKKVKEIARNEIGHAIEVAESRDKFEDLADLMGAWVAHLEDDRPELAERSLQAYRVSAKHVIGAAGDWLCERFGMPELE